jgi:Glycosyltransferase family 87
MHIGGPRVGRQAVAIGLLVFSVYIASLWFERFGIGSARQGADMGPYRLWASAISHGQLPYRSFYFEYPPGALAPMLAAQPFSDYATAFKVVMAVVGVGTLLIAAAALREPARRSLWPLLAMAASPFVVGSVFVNRFDLWPALLMAAALLLLIHGRPSAAFAFLAMGTVTKIFPVAALPAAAVWVWRTHGSRKMKQASIVFAATALLVILPFAIIGPGGLRYSFTVQLTRHLQIESLGAAILLTAARAGLYHPTIATGNPGSLDLFGTLPDVAGAVSLVIVVVLVVYGARLLAQGQPDVDRLIAGIAGAMCIYVAFGKVLSPQYMLWLVPLVPLVRRRSGAAGTAILLVALALTQVEFDHYYSQLHSVGPIVWAVLARDLLLVLLTALLLNASRNVAWRER